MERFLVRNYTDLLVNANNKPGGLNEHPPLLQELLAGRGITTAEEADHFLNPDYVRDIHDPFLMKDMDRVLERILKAIDKNEKIVIFSDYDADGIPGAVVLHDFFKKIGFNNFENYIPHRHDEGFGLNVDAVKQFAESGAKLVITIDCGIADIEPAKLAKELGLDLIITDHHEPLENLPQAYAILNPKQADCEYPEKMLCGAGVIFKLVQAFLIKHREKFSDTEIKDGWEKWLLDMVGLATLSDMVPLRGENRALAYYGLKVLRVSPRVGLMKLIRKAGSQQKNITEEDIGFTITPRINAASRMGIPMEAFSLLSTKDDVEADMLVVSLNKKNDERKGLVASMAKDINHRIKERSKNEALREVIVMGNPDWKPSLLGLVANSLKDDHARPVFLWGREEAKLIKGSCRSDGVVSVVDLMKEVEDIFINFGGHTRSGGFSMEQEHIHLFEDRLVSAYKKLTTSLDGKDLPVEKQAIDKILSVNDINWQTWKIVEQLGPFGVGNPKPVFLFDDVVVDSMKQFGKEKNHFEMSLGKSDVTNTVGTRGAGKITAIRFFTKPENLSYTPEVGGRARIVANLEKSMFRNYPELRLRIIDVLAP